MAALAPVAAAFAGVILLGTLAVAVNDVLERWLANRADAGRTGGGGHVRRPGAPTFTAARGVPAPRPAVLVEHSPSVPAVRGGRVRSAGGPANGAAARSRHSR